MYIMNFLTAFMFIGLGYLVKYKKMSFLVAGFNTASEEDKQNYDIDKMCNYVGNMLFSIAGILIAMSILEITAVLSSKFILLSGWALISILIVVMVIIMNSNNRIMKS